MSKLFIVPTPIGNLEDITLRALAVLKEVDFILAEDTRNSGILLKYYNISKPLFSYHQHNEHKIFMKIAERILSGKSAALVSDAGMPAISDPGFLLVRACLQNDIQVETLPGATAFLPALVNSGLPADHFIFEGFLPHKKGRRTILEKLCRQPYTIIFYESPHRLIKTLEQIAEFFGNDRPASVSRELTKLFEETIRGSLAEIIRHFSSQSGLLKGEFVIVVAGIK
jgi:16S rRNA (cytidine1402-2'-O)-methyltransferase